MKVMLVNGSPHKAGCTYTALNEIAKELNKEGIETEIFQVGTKPIAGCIACGVCKEKKKCTFDDDVNVFLDKAKGFDGFIFGSPVHYAAAGGAITSFLNRAFYTDSNAGTQIFYMKPGAAIVSARRAGTTAAFDQLNKYFTLSQMPIISSCYWNMVHGNTPEDVLKDFEGIQTMQILGKNMAYFLKCQAAADAAGVKRPEKVDRVKTNFI